MMCMNRKRWREKIPGKAPRRVLEVIGSSWLVTFIEVVEQIRGALDEYPVATLRAETE